MRKIIFISALICVITLKIAGQESSDIDTLVTVKSQLKDTDDGTPLRYAHILNPGLGIGTTSDSLGFFTIYMERNDSLLISAIGYIDTHFTLPTFWPSNLFSDPIRIRKQMYLIEGVSVQSLGSYQQFKQKILNARPPKSSAEQTTEYINRAATQEAVEWSSVRVGINFSMKSKEEKSLKKLKLILDEQEKIEIINSKFNKRNVGELTGLKGEELVEFMDYCNLPEEFLLNASEYDILDTVKRMYRAYYKRKESK